MKKDYKFNQYYKSLNVFSIALILLSLIFLIFKGLNYGVDFKGGTLIEIRVETENPDIEVLRSSFNKMNLGKISIKNFGSDNDFVVKFKRDELNDPEFIENLQRNLSQELTQDFSFRRVENVGPKVSSELLKAGVTAICLSLMAMLIYIWIRFEWQFSVGAIAALFHDVIITLGIFSALSLEINLSIVAAVLTIVGYSMNDTVVIYDRVRENLKKYSDIKIFDLTNLSINETLSRTIITSSTTLLALVSIFLFGGEILKGFSLAMILGVILGTYSSIFIANPLLVFFKVSQKTVLKENN